MTRLPTYTIWFNMPLKSTRVLKNGLAEDTFETTVKMSSYLVAFVIADGFATIKDVTKNGVKVSEINRRGRCHRGHYTRSQRGHNEVITRS